MINCLIQRNDILAFSMTENAGFLESLLNLEFALADSETFVLSPLFYCLFRNRSSGDIYFVSKRKRNVIRRGIREMNARISRRTEVCL